MSRRKSSRPSTNAGRATTMSSPPAASARPMTTSPPTASPRPSACRSSSIPRPRPARAPLPPGGLNEARLRMANMPEGADLIDNPVSAAPGFRIGNVFVLAGRAVGHARHVRWAEGSLAGGAPVLSRDGRRLSRRRSHRRRAWARCSGDIPIWTSAAIPSFARAAMAPASCCAAPSSARSPPPPRSFAR